MHTAQTKGFQRLGSLDHVSVVSYEEMAAKPFNEVLRISEFLDCAYSDDELMKLTEFGIVHTKRRNTYFLSNVFVSKSNFKPFPVSVTEEKSMNIIMK